MITIAHRGNLKGPNSKLENKPSYIDIALNKGLHAEIDLRYEKNKYYLGHDESQYKVDYSWLDKRRLSLHIHCKNLWALNNLLEFKFNDFYEFDFFWHENDAFTLTSNGKIWTYPGRKTTKNSIIVDLNKERKKYKGIYGICVDYA